MCPEVLGLARAWNTSPPPIAKDPQRDIRAPQARQTSPNEGVPQELQGMAATDSPELGATARASRIPQRTQKASVGGTGVRQ
jgi:hypothetical protein